MATKKKSATQQKPAQEKKQRKVRYAVLENGERHEILREDGKYLYCTDTTIRHSDARLMRIESQMVDIDEEPKE